MKNMVRAGMATAMTVAGLAVAGGHAAPALAASPCILTISQVIGYPQYRVEVGCGNLGRVVSFKVYGSDEFFDDYQFTVTGSWTNVPKTWCNEDIGDRDELYAKVTYVTDAGATRNLNTDVVYGWF